MEYQFSFRPYRLPLHPPLRTAHGLWREREGLLIRLENEMGRTGFGEIAPIPWFGTETLEEAVAMCRKMGDKTDDRLLDAVPEEMGCVRFALDAARAEDALPIDGTRVPLTALLPAGRGAVDVLSSRLEAGWLSFKWKVGVDDPDHELGWLDELLERLPAYATLRLDANGGWTRKQAARWLGRCAERPIEFVEQPLAPAEVDSLMGLARDFPVTLALDESVVRLADAREWQGRGWPGVFVIKPALAGPLGEVRAWCAQTQADVVLSSAIETALGRACIWRYVLGGHPELVKRSPGFGVGELFNDRGWDGPFTGPILDAGWSQGVNPEERWNALA